MPATMRVLVVALLLSWAPLRFAAATESPAAAPLGNERQAAGEVLRLADERLAVMPLVAAAKWPKHQPITDPVREEAVIAAAGARALAMGLSRAEVEQFFRLQIRLAREEQVRVTAHWNTDGYDSVQPYPDLANDLRPRLDSLTGRLLNALYVAVPALSRPDAAATLQELAIEVLPDARWSGPDRSSLVAALAAVRYVRPGSLERARAAGLLRIGTPADYAPFGVADAGAVTGADIELAQDLARALGLQPVFLRTTWATLLDDLARDRFDVVVGGVSATPARLQVADASMPLSRSGKTAIGRCSDRGQYASMADIDRATVTVVENPGGTNEAFARSHLSAAHLVVHADNRTVFDEILGRRADVMFTDETEIALASHRHPELCRLLTEAYDPADKVFLFRRDAGWREAIDPWLMIQINSNVPARLLQQYLSR